MSMFFFSACRHHSTKSAKFGAFDTVCPPCLQVGGGNCPSAPRLRCIWWIYKYIDQLATDEFQNSFKKFSYWLMCPWRALLCEHEVAKTTIFWAVRTVHDLPLSRRLPTQPASSVFLAASEELRSFQLLVWNSVSNFWAAYPLSRYKLLTRRMY